MRIEAMTEFRDVLQSRTVQAIPSKMQILMTAAGGAVQIPEHRTHKPMER